jgi:hypothetical protein
MQFKVNIPPIKRIDKDFVGRQCKTKTEIMRRIDDHKFAYRNQINHPMTGGFVIAWNIQKNRRKTQDIFKKKKVDGKMQMVKTREVVRQAHWTGHVYHFPVDFLKMIGMTVVQGSRTFTLVSTKR